MNDNGNGAEHLSWQVPNNWAWASMGKIAEVVGGGTPRTNDPSNFDDGDIPWITPADLSGYKEQYIAQGARNITSKGLQGSGARLMPAGTVLFSSRAPIGYVAIASQPVSTNQGFKSFVLNDGVDPGYVYYYLKYAKDIATALASGTTFLEISGAKASQIPIPLPPLPEQRRIVAAIETQFTRLDASVAALVRARANLKRYRAAVLKAACEGRLVPTEAEVARAEGRGYEAASVLLERIAAVRDGVGAHGGAPGSVGNRRGNRTRAHGRAPLQVPQLPIGVPALPEGWCWATVERLASRQPGSIQSGPFGSQLLHSEFVDHGILAIGIDNVLAGHFSMGRQHRITEQKFRDLKKFEARPSDVLITVMATVGRCCVVPKNLESAIITKHVYRITANQIAVVPTYLMICLWGGEAVRAQLFGQVKGQTRPGINGEILRRLEIPVPPLAEQHRIVAEVERRLSVVEEMEGAIGANLKRAERLRQAILRRAFAGKLVAQDPTDEPASALLARIRAERAVQEKSKPTRGKGRTVGVEQLPLET